MIISPSLANEGGELYLYSDNFKILEILILTVYVHWIDAIQASNTLRTRYIGTFERNTNNLNIQLWVLCC